MQVPSADGPRDAEAIEEEENGVKRKIGPLSDYFEEGGPTHYPEDTKTLLEQLSVPRDPNAEVDISSERERNGARLEQISDLLEKEQAKEASLGAVREELGIGQSAVKEGAVEKFEQAKEELLEEELQLSHAEEYNDALESLAKLSDEELQSVLDAGVTKEGKQLRTKRNRELSADEARELAALAKSGVKRVTWKMLSTLMQFVDRVLDDLVAPWKKMIGLGGK